MFERIIFEMDIIILAGNVFNVGKIDTGTKICCTKKKEPPKL